MRRKPPRYRIRIGRTGADLLAVRRLRQGVFHGSDGTPDADAFDTPSHHVMIETTSTHALVCCFRLLPLSCGAEIDQSYSAQFYGLTLLRDYPGRMVEVGRFCVDPAYRDPDILRLAWAALTRFVDTEEIEMLFGCSSFQGTETAQYLDAFAMLKEHHLAPERWQPRVKAPHVFRFARRLRRKADPKAAARAMPPLLRTYLAMGGWVSDHAVVDRDLGTLHVFTGLEVRSIPPARARLLRAAA